MSFYNTLYFNVLPFPRLHWRGRGNTFDLAGRMPRRENMHAAARILPGKLTGVLSQAYDRSAVSLHQSYPKKVPRIPIKVCAVPFYFLPLASGGFFERHEELQHERLPQLPQLPRCLMPRSTMNSAVPSTMASRI